MSSLKSSAGRDSSSQAAGPSRSARFGRAALLVLFALILLIPKALGLRRRSRVWNLLRVVTGLAGLGILAGGIAGEWSGTMVAGGSLLIFVAVLARPAVPGKNLDDVRAALGGVVTLNGGLFAPPQGRSRPVYLVAGSSRLHVIGRDHTPLAELPLAELSSLSLQAAPPDWHLVLDWAGGSWVFRYRGFFAEHLARVAENTVRTLHQAHQDSNNPGTALSV